MNARLSFKWLNLVAIVLGLAVPAQAITSVALSAPGSATTNATYYVSASGSDDFGEIISLIVTRNGSYWASAYSIPWDYTRYAISVGDNNTAPSSPGSVSFYAVMDTDSTSVNDSKSVTINPAAPAITSSLTASGTVGAGFSYSITGSNSPTSYNATGLPSGLSVNTGSGAITGTPSGSGATNVTISATNAGGTGSATLVITVTVAAPAITSSLTKSGTAGTSLSYSITGSNTPTSYNATGLPSGLSVNTGSGAITGTPSGSGTTNSTISATNAGGTGSATLVFTIAAAAPAITSSLTKSGTVGTSLSYSITGSNSPTSYGATGLPAGLSVNTGTGAITGTPSASGTTNATISATNASGTGSATLVFTINPAAPVITSALTKSGVVNTSLSYSITGSNSPTSYGATGLPAGLSVNTSSGAITGTPTASGTTNATISATNATGTGSDTLVFTISPPAPVIISPLEAAAMVNVAGFSYTIRANGSPTSFSATGLPAGLSVLSSSGVISGTPTASGTTNVTIGATNATGTGTATLVITIGADNDNDGLTDAEEALLGTSTSTTATSDTGNTVIKLKVHSP
ncbi:MAG: putative Ig domain-containing protein [Opitutaceae bacterium]|nr:putative Ig domain-containing protein [Opitutaceae bacterium]